VCRYKNKYREKVERQYRIVNPRATRDEIDEMFDSGNQQQEIFTQQILQGSHAAAKNALADIQERHNDIMKLETSIAELHQLFVDMSVLVESQGELLDQVEYQVSQSVNYTGKARAPTRPQLADRVPADRVLAHGSVHLPSACRRARCCCGRVVSVWRCARARATGGERAAPGQHLPKEGAPKDVLRHLHHPRHHRRHRRPPPPKHELRQRLLILISAPFARPRVVPRERAVCRRADHRRNCAAQTGAGVRPAVVCVAWPNGSRCVRCPAQSVPAFAPGVRRSLARRQCRRNPV
jgi:hypothetical protein